MGIISEQNKFASNTVYLAFFSSLLVFCFVCHRWNNNSEVICNLLHERSKKYRNFPTEIHYYGYTHTASNTIESMKKKCNRNQHFLYSSWAKQTFNSPRSLIKNPIDLIVKIDFQPIIHSNLCNGDYKNLISRLLWIERVLYNIAHYIFILSSVVSTYPL